MQLNFELMQLVYDKDAPVHQFFIHSFHNSRFILVQPQSDASVKF